jgi:glycosyltransferase involved in cell wall biosynthesis
MRILCILNGGSETASARERILRYIPDLEKAGIRVETRIAGDITPGFWGRTRYWIWLYRALRRCDGVLLHRVPLSARELSLIRRSSRPILFDVDDAIWFEMEPSADGTPRPSPRQSELLATLRQCRIVRAGNRELARFLEPLHLDVRIAPTCVRAAAPPREPRPGPPVIGWTGHSVNFRYLGLCAPALRRLLLERPGVNVRVVADRAPDLPGVPMDFVPWSPEGESGQLRSFDIGIMPLADTPWARGKCGYKLLLYMSHGLPVVASPVGVNADLVTHGKNGYLAGTPDEWHDRLLDLVDHPDRRLEMGHEGRTTVEGRYDHAAGLQNLIRGLRDATASR